MITIPEAEEMERFILLENLQKSTLMFVIVSHSKYQKGSFTVLFLIALSY